MCRDNGFWISLTDLRLGVLLAVVVLGCGDTEDEVSSAPLLVPDAGVTSDVGDGVPELDMMAAASVTARFKLLDPVSARGVSGVSASFESQMSTTDGQGETTLDLTMGAYAVRFEKSGVRAHTIFGVSNEQAFTQVSYFSSEQITRAVFGSLGIADDPTRGTVVVGLDRPNLSAAVGATASLDAASDPPFVLSRTGAVTGDTIGQGQLGFVTFPNVQPGLVDVTVGYAGGECAIFPAEEGAVSLVVEPGEVSVVAYTCR